ncbi:Slam-dependent surface lipoprotein [Pasteurella testudinis]|uniref:Slam-dependent surface lipoprotein n=1 Tax=Pasteurella testudinis TaxID=761 RepID=UPI004057E68D
MKKVIFSTALLASLVSMGVAQATVTAGINAPTDKGKVFTLPEKGSAEHNGWFHTDEEGLPGVDIKGVSTKVSSFKSLTGVTKRTEFLGVFGGIDDNDVVVLKMNNMPSWVPGFHNKLGNFAFKKVGAEELYYGEWLVRDGDINQDRVVYYAGNNKTANMPTGGKATYSVSGINKNTELNQPLLTGSLNADFNANTLKGNMRKSGLLISIDAGINNAEASFKGNAKANGINGQTEGNFFGNNAAALAGVAKFDGNNQFDTAFGGTKQ